MVKTKKPPLYPNKNIIKGALRRVFTRTPLVREVLEESVHPTKKGVRGGKQYVCAECKNAFPGNQVQADHRIPVVPLDKTIHDLDYNQIVERIFCKKQNLQVLCKDCHKEKSAEERKARKKYKDKLSNA